MSLKDARGQKLVPGQLQPGANAVLVAGNPNAVDGWESPVCGGKCGAPSAATMVLMTLWRGFLPPAQTQKAQILVSASQA